MYFKNVIDALGHTPLVELAKMTPTKKVRILAKLEGQNPGGSASMKDRVAKYMIEQAERSGELTRDKTILEATSGNTGIALAWLGRQKGYRVTIVMPDSMSQERRQLLRIFGAELIMTDGTFGMPKAIATAREMAAKDKKYFMPDQFSNPANPLAHYETTAVEILDDFPYDKIDVLVCGLGTGGTLMGVARRFRERYPDVRVIGLEPPIGDSIQGLKCLGEELPPFWDPSLLDEKTMVTSQQAAAAARELLEKEGIFAGLSSGAVAYQAVATAAGMGEGNIVAVLADAGWKYLSTEPWSEAR
jgi:cysteine synthase